MADKKTSGAEEKEGRTPDVLYASTTGKIATLEEINAASHAIALAESARRELMHKVIREQVDAALNAR